MIRNSAASILGLVLLAGAVSAQTGQPQTAPAAPPAIREVTDETGRRVRLPAEVRRIVSLAPNLTETLYALGVEDRLAGVTDYCDFPPEAQSKPKIGGAINPSLEHIVRLAPDLVLAQAYTMNRRETVEALDRLGLAVYATNSRSVEGMIDSTLRIAELVGVLARGETLAAELRRRLAELERRLAGRPPRRVLFVVWHEPLVSVGRDTFIADALRQAGAESVVEVEQDWPRLGLEEIVHLQPEYLVFASSHPEGAARAFEELHDRPGWRALDAVRHGRFAVISDAVNRPAPRLVDAIEQLARQLHPDAFSKKAENRKEKVENSSVQSRTSDPGIPTLSFLLSIFESRPGGA